MSDAPDRLPPELDAFLAPERRRPDPPGDMQGEIFARLGATLGWFGGSGPGSGPDGSDPSGGGGPPGGDVGGGGGLAVHGAKHAAAGTVVKASLAKTVATLVVGGVLGSAVHEAYDRVSERRAERARPVAVATPPVAAPAPPPIATRDPEPVPEPVPEPAAAPAVPRAASPAPKVDHAARSAIRERDRNLAAERALIEQARTAIAREQAATALAALERHARDFPQGALEEERESLLVPALVGVERFDPARKTAARFHKRFPRSIFAAVVDEALKTIP
jgi:hypothetical protein